MANINQITIAGNLTRDAELKYTAGQMAICELSLAVNKSRKKNNEWTTEVSYFDVTAFGKLAEANARLSKGECVLVVGELKQERWEKDGQKRSAVKIIANGIFADNSEEDATSQERPERSDEHSQAAPRPNPNQPAPEEIPFSLLWILISISTLGGLLS